MNRNEFLNALRYELEGTAPQELEQIIADYDAYFGEGIAAGRSENAVADTLGTPRQLAYELKTEVRIKAWEERRTLSNLLRLFNAATRLCIGDIVFSFPLWGAAFAMLVCVLIATVMLAAGGLVIYANLTNATLPFRLVIDVAGVELTRQTTKLVAGAGVSFSALLWFAFDVWLLKRCGGVLVKYARKRYRVVRGV